MANPPTVSVVIPCYNSGKTIAETLASVGRQSVGNIEILVVDDGSSDPSCNVVAAAAESDPRIRLIRQANAGVSAARNTGIAAARADFVALMDSDDLWAPTHLARHLQRFAADPLLGVSFSPTRFVDLEGRPTGLTRPKLDGLTTLDFLTGNPTTTCSALVIRAAVFKDAGLFDPSLRRDEDQEWLFRAALTSWTISGHGDALVDYRTSPHGLASDLEGMYAGFERMLAVARKVAPDVVARDEARARATTYRYLARRALRLDRGRQVARHYMAKAVRSCPTLIVREPKATVAMLAAAFVPGVGGLIYRDHVQA